MATKTIFIWVLAFVITAASAVYQRMTGPTYEKRGSVDIAGEIISYEMFTTHEGETDMPVRVAVPGEQYSGLIFWKRHKVEEPWMQVPMVLEDGNLIGYLPNQPAAGKLDYTVTLSAGDEEIVISDRGRAIVTRFKGVVPAWVLLPHILAMFIGMLLSTRTGFEVIFKRDNLKQLTIWTFGFLFAGGMILGPIMQYLAFGDWWTGFPFGWDLTDNKTLIALIAWGWALWAVLKDKPARVPALIASIVTLIIFLIPHSVLGSELDYTAEGI